MIKRKCFLFLHCLSVGTALQGMKPAVPKSSQRSAIAIPPQPFADSTNLPFPIPNVVEEVNSAFPSISIALPDLQKQPVVEQQEETSASSLLSRELFGEAFGTFWIVGIGSLASMAATFSDPFSATPLSEVALVWSLAVTSAIFFCTQAQWSQAHFNPAMTLASALFRGFSWNKVIPYSLAQVAGATAGSAMAYSCYSNAIRQYELHQGLMRCACTETARVFREYFASSLTHAQAFGIEALGTAILAATAFFVTHPSQSKKKKKNKLPVPVVMGGTVFSLINWLAPYTQAGMNPARDFGPRLVAFAAGWTDIAFQGSWLYILAPLVGAILGAGLVDKVLLADSNQKAT
jgi:glycerol uptake facilitator protein